jgi:hypothetical protein
VTAERRSMRAWQVRDLAAGQVVAPPRWLPELGILEHVPHAGLEAPPLR